MDRKWNIRGYFFFGSVQGFDTNKRISSQESLHSWSYSRESQHSWSYSQDSLNSWSYSWESLYSQSYTQGSLYSCSYSQESMCSWPYRLVFPIIQPGIPLFLILQLGIPEILTRQLGISVILTLQPGIPVFPIIHPGFPVFLTPQPGIPVFLIPCHKVSWGIPLSLYPQTFPVVFHGSHFPSQSRPGAWRGTGSRHLALGTPEPPVPRGKIYFIDNFSLTSVPPAGWDVGSSAARGVLCLQEQ